VQEKFTASQRAEWAGAQIRDSGGTKVPKMRWD
jgi:hypothetical protein